MDNYQDPGWDIETTPKSQSDNLSLGNALQVLNKSFQTITSVDHLKTVYSHTLSNSCSATEAQKNVFVCPTTIWLVLELTKLE